MWKGAGLVISVGLIVVTFGATLDHGTAGVHAHGGHLDERTASSPEEQKAQEFLKSYEASGNKECKRASEVEWTYATDITPQNEQLKLASAVENAKFEKEAWINATSFNWKEFKDEKLKRQFKTLSILGIAALPDDKFKEYNEITTNMETIYSSATICEYQSSKCGLSLEPEITQIMAKSRNYFELEHIWTEWHDKSGGKMRDLYPKFVEMSNQAAKLNNFTNTVAMWMVPYESDTFRDDIEKLWQNLRPLYDQLHAYMRFKLSKIYGADKVKPDAPIPAHLLGNMWAQSWKNLLADTVPYPGLPSVDVTDEMNLQGYTPQKMFQVAEEFFTSLDLKPMTNEFWNNSLIEKPSNGKTMVCHASAWDFCDGKDVRIKQCTRVNMEDLITVHHEMGHIEYYLQYKDQPRLFRTGANPGFHEAVGDTLALSASTPKHLHTIGLLKNYTQSHEVEINSLFAFAAEKVAFIPFAYLMDRWRWDVFEGKVKPGEYNCHWWKLREEYQGVQAPKPRGADKFDPGAKYHIAANVEYLRYFVSHVLQFQFHKALCIEAGQYNPENPTTKPLHNCDIYKSKEAGRKMSAMLALGASVSWPEALEVGTGSRKMDTGAFREYFAPLEKWLEEENKKNGVQIGWKRGDGRCVSMKPVEPEPEPKPTPKNATTQNIGTTVTVKEFLHTVTELEPTPKNATTQNVDTAVTVKEFLHTVTELEPKPKNAATHENVDTAVTVKEFLQAVTNKVSDKKSEVKQQTDKKSSANSVYSSVAIVLLALLRMI